MAGFNKASTKKLFNAVSKNNAKAIPRLVTDGADPNAQSKEFSVAIHGVKGATPLTLAACGSRPNVIEALAKAGADPDLEAKGSGMTPLMASGFNTLNLKKLLALGANPDATAGSRKETALHYFIKWSMESACQALVRAGANPSVTNKHGVSATEYALDEGYDDLHALFVKAQKTTRSGSAAKRSQSSPSADDFMNVLIDGTAAQVKKMVKAGCEANLKLSGRYPIEICVRHDNVTAAKVLLELGADAKIVDLSDCDLDSKMLPLLLDNGADPNANISLLMHAIEKGKIKAVKLLVEAGAKLRTKDGRHEIAIAEMYGHDKLAMYLSKRFTDPNKLKPSKTLVAARDLVEKTSGAKLQQLRSLPVRFKCVVDLKSVLSKEEKSNLSGRTKNDRQRRQSFAARKVALQLLGKLPKCECYSFDNGELLLIEKKDRFADFLFDRKTVAWLKDVEKQHPFLVFHRSGGTLELQFASPISANDLKSRKKAFPKSKDGPQLRQFTTKGFSINFDVD